MDIHEYGSEGSYMPFIKNDVQEENREFEEMLRDPERKKQYEVFAQEYELKKQLAQARRERGLTQQELSDRTGLSQQAISRIERVNDSGGFTFRTLFRYLDGIGYELTLKKML